MIDYSFINESLLWLFTFYNCSAASRFELDCNVLICYLLRFEHPDTGARGDGDPLDVLVVTPHPVAPGSVIRARPVGVLHMTDDGGGDAKLIAVPHDKLTVLYRDIKEYTDLPELLIQQIQHFFENYKDLEAGKWVKIDRWGNAEEARAEIVKAVNAYQK